MHSLRTNHGGDSTLCLFWLFEEDRPVIYILTKYGLWSKNIWIAFVSLLHHTEKNVSDVSGRVPTCPQLSRLESRRGYGNLSLVIVVVCQIEVSAMDRLLVQRSSTECGVSECDGQNSIMWKPRFTRTVEPRKKDTQCYDAARHIRNYNIVTGYCSSSSITLTIRRVLSSYNPT
jgi:hypothetical protein